MAGNVKGRIADNEPEYAHDAAADAHAEVVDAEPDDPRKLPPDLPDSGTADPPGG